jgi:hypothetical protein
VLVNPGRELYRAWGLGEGSAWYVMNPTAIWHTWQLGTKEGIWYVSKQSPFQPLPFYTQSHSQVPFRDHPAPVALRPSIDGIMNPRLTTLA